MFVMRDGDGPVEVGGARALLASRSCVHALRHAAWACTAEMFERADANHDGRVSLQEMTAAALQHFDAADANHDGKLTPDERMQMHQQRQAQRKQPA